MQRRHLHTSVMLLVPFLGVGLFLEASARLIRPAKPSPWRFGAEFGYEPRPTGSSREGFRSPDVAVPKPPRTKRVLVLGDSVAFSSSVAYEESWARLLEKRLGSQGLPVQVLSAGVPGYVSAQVVERFLRRGARYEPDLVIALVGWNDLGYSSLPEWHHNINLSELKAAWLQEPTTHWLGSRFLGLLRSRIGPTSTAAVRPAAAGTRGGSALPFNEPALQTYLSNLETLRVAAATRGSRLAVVLWPTILKLPHEEDVERKASTTFAHYPLSWREFEAWYDRYIAALREFAGTHPEVLLVDPNPAFLSRFVPDAQFTDLCHLTTYGEATLAEVVWSEIQERL